jgi:hypothetical protein
MLSLLLVGLALAQDPLPDEPVAAPTARPYVSVTEVPALPAGSSAATPPVSLEALWASQPREVVLEDAVNRILAYDLAGAEARLRFLDAQGPAADTTYRLGYIAEQQERWYDAIERYGEVRAAWPEHPEARDAAFRMALCLEEVGLPAESGQVIAELHDSGGLSALDQQALALQRAIVELKAGKVRRGKRHLAAAMAPLQGTTDLAWLQARAHVALAGQALREAEALPLGNSRRQVKNLERRAALIKQAETEVTAATQTHEVDAILRGLVLLGDGYVQLHDALIAIPPPEGLTADQQALFRAELGKKAQVLEVKAQRIYDNGVSVALRTGYEGSLKATLTARRDALGPPG